MKRLLYQIFLILLFSFNISYAQLPNPKYEMRGIWIASLGIDWPASKGTSSSVITAQKNELISIFDKHKSYGMNTMFFHVRPMCDAVYKSSIEPWSSYLTGSQGTAPSDANYDPLKFACDEAHKRGMELHAWLNPYRALLSGGSTSSLSSTHVVKAHPEWIIKCSTTEYRFLNPGLPEVRKYVVKVIMDIVRRYDVDGIHFDDYFYPYSDYGTFTDDSAWNKYRYGFTDRNQWRMNNVNLLLKMISDSINSVKPWVKFGMSPSGNPSVNTSIYCSPSDWLKGKYTDTLGVAQTTTPYIDYILPQLYWVNFNGQLSYWSSAAFLNNRHFYIGHAAYRFAETSWPKTECAKQIDTSRKVYTCKGSVYFSSKSVTDNLANCADTMRRNFYTNNSINARMAWKPDNVAPNPPRNLRFELNTATSKYELRWDTPSAASDGDTAMFYVVYRSNGPNINTSLGSNVVATTGEKYLYTGFAHFSTTSGNYYVVSAVDRNSNESANNPAIVLDTTGNIPAAPVLAFPYNGSIDRGSSTPLRWLKTPGAESYLVQISLDPTFAGNGVCYLYEIKDTIIQFASVLPGNKYYWRVQAANIYGNSQYSAVFSFQSATAVAPVLAQPANAAANIAKDLTFKWNKVVVGTSYQIQLSTTSSFTSGTVIFDKTLTDTSYQHTTVLSASTTYYWHVKTINSLGQSDWSSAYSFQTGDFLDVADVQLKPSKFELLPNYPNPFNPSTSIRFTLPVKSHVQISVYDIMGNEIARLVNGVIDEGSHEVNWNAADKSGGTVSSGIYFCRMTAENFTQMRKMLLIR